MYFCGLTPAKRASHGNLPTVSVTNRDTVLFLLTTNRNPAHDGSKRFHTTTNLPAGAGESSWPSDYRVHLNYWPGDAEIDIETKERSSNGFTESRVRKECCNHEAEGVTLFLGARYSSADLSLGVP